MARLSTVRASHRSEDLAPLTESPGVIEPFLLHRCRFGQALYDWRATAMVGRFICRGCGMVGECGACSELRGQEIPPGVAPAVCALHGGLLEIGISDVALAVDFPAPVLPRSKTARPRRTQLTLLPWVDAEHRKDHADPTRSTADTTTR